jgi:microcystin-dependent protein
MDKINFLLKDNFPFTIKTANKLQSQSELLAKLTAIGGDNYILSGCVDTEDIVSNGYIVINGELLPFVGGDIKAKITIIEARETATAFGVDYPDAYVNRHAELSDTGDLIFVDYKQVVSNEELSSKIATIKGEPIGITQGWIGFLDKIPDNYMLCDGRTLKIVDYPELHEVIGTFFGAVGVTEFKLPNTMGKFRVAYNPNDSDYNEIGKTGGEKNTSLTVAQLPSHNHSGSALSSGNHNHGIENGGDSEVGSGYLQGDSDAVGSSNLSNAYTKTTGQHTHTLSINNTGNGDSHENRPPYFVQGEIIKVKN